MMRLYVTRSNQRAPSSLVALNQILKSTSKQQQVSPDIYVFLDYKYLSEFSFSV
jgi:hypothetical protein